MTMQQQFTVFAEPFCLSPRRILVVTHAAIDCLAKISAWYIRLWTRCVISS